MADPSLPKDQQAISASAASADLSACPISAMSSYSIGISSHFQDKLRQAIMERKFVDFALLLPDAKSFSPTTINVHDSSGQTVVNLGQKASTRELHIGPWMTAYLVFMDIYCLKFPSELSGILIIFS